MHEVLVNRLVKLAQEKGVVRIYHSQTRRHMINGDSELLKLFGSGIHEYRRDQGIFCPSLGAEYRPHSQSKIVTFT